MSRIAFLESKVSVVVLLRLLSLVIGPFSFGCNSTEPEFIGDWGQSLDIVVSSRFLESPVSDVKVVYEMEYASGISRTLLGHTTAAGLFRYSEFGYLRGTLLLTKPGFRPQTIILPDDIPGYVRDRGVGRFEIRVVLVPIRTEELPNTDYVESQWSG